MKITLIPSAVSRNGQEDPQFLTSFLVNDTVVIDAGSVGFFQTPQEQALIRHVLISHTHIDHLASLPIFLENAFENRSDPVTIHGSADVLDCLARDLFNNRLWPDFIALSAGDVKFLRLQVFVPGQTFHLDGLRITPVTVNHVVPTVGFIIEDNHAAVIIPSDTGPTGEIWACANRTPNLKAVFLEATFPNAMAQLADIAKHLTPATFGQEVRKLRQQPALYAVHMKPRYRDQVISELQALGLPHLEIAQCGRAYHF